FLGPRIPKLTSYGTDLKTNSVNCRAPLFNRDQSKQKKAPATCIGPCRLDQQSGSAKVPGT
ncbi:MAG: hypothetical protein WBZ08_14140, partial [Pseudolabrys sp.]